ncbi:MAG: hypothetical protein IKL55_07075 [Clostridia bacterium]|nr:hypothetical protein [Clostridia bacterium]
MIKVLIICKYNLTAKSIVNHVISKISDLRLIGIGNNLKEGVELLEMYEPSLIFTTSQKFLDYLNDNCTTYTPGIILISKPIPNQPASYRFKKLLMHIHNTNNFKIISEQTFKFISNNYSTSKKKVIKNILLDIGFDFKLIGTNFLLDSIVYITTYKGAKNSNNLEGEIFPYIARRHKTSPKIVKWAIIRSISYLYQKCDSNNLSKIEEYFNVKYPKKITTKTIVKSILTMLDD